jgi:glutamine synthetase
MTSTIPRIYFQTLEEALPAPERVAQVRDELLAAGVEYVLSCWIDLLGVPKTKPVPISQFENLCLGKGPQFAVHSVSMVPELGPADSDQIALPDLDSVIICPWDRRYAWVFADLFWEGEAYYACPRQLLKRQMQQAADKGYTFMSGMEPEFMVLRRTGDTFEKAFGHDTVKVGDEPIQRQPYGYDVGHSIDAAHFLEAVTKHLKDLDWNLTNVVCEGAYSQFELDYGFFDVLTTADRFTFLRVLLQEVAKEQGLFVTYMPKPTNGDWRNGAHINLSVRPVGETDNLFENEEGTWSELAYQAVAGLLTHGAALTCVTCPTVNSYAGLTGSVAGLEGGTLTWAPTHITYGDNNRSAMIRLPQTRIAVENRAVDMTVNAYSAMALTTAAALEGMEKKLDPGPPVNKPLYTLSAAEAEELGARRLPANLLDAVRAFEADELAQEVFGPKMHAMYSTYKHVEWARFHEHVTDWEQREYLRFF